MHPLTFGKESRKLACLGITFLSNIGTLANLLQNETQSLDQSNEYSSSETV